MSRKLRRHALAAACFVVMFAPFAACKREVGVELDHQPPVAALQGPSEVERGKPAEYTVEARARTGSIRGYTFEVHRENVDLVRREESSDPHFTHAFDQPGIYYVSVIVADSEWATGRASLAVRVAASRADDKTPPVVALEVARGGQVLGAGAGLSFGDKLSIKVSAKDAELGVGELSLRARLGTTDVPLDQPSVYKPQGSPKSAEHSFELVVPSQKGELDLEAAASDVAVPANASQPVQQKLPVTAKDSDGDGLSDDEEVGGCASPQIFNGLRVGVWSLAPFPKALCWLTPRPAGETLFNQVTSSAPAYTTKVTTGLLSQSGSGAIGTVISGAPPAVAGLTTFALYYTGKLCVPAGAASLDVTATADDVLVVVVDGKPVAANDAGLGCTTFFSWGDFAYVKSTASVKVAGLTSVPLALLAANETGAWNFTAKLTFKNAAGDPIAVTLDQKMFQAP